MQFVGVPGATDASTQLQGAAARLFAGSRTRLLLNVNGSLVRYRTLTQLDRNTYSVAIETDRRLSRRTSVTLQATSQSDLINRSIGSVGDGALLTKLVTARSNDVSSTLAYRFSSELSSHMTARAQQVAFATEGFSTGRIAVANAGLDRRLGRHASIFATGEYRYSEVGGTYANLQQYTLGTNAQLSEHISLNLGAGGTVGAGLGSDIASHASGNGSLSVHSQRNIFSLDAQRVIGQQFGSTISAVQITNQFGASLSRYLTRALYVDGRASKGFSNTASGTTPRIESAEGVVAVRYATRLGATVGVGGYVRQLRNPVTVVSKGLTATFGYAWAQHGSTPTSILKTTSR